MRDLEPAFDLEFDGKKIRVSEHAIADKRVFHVDFKGVTDPLIITVGYTATGKKFWTSIPQGRQVEAEQIGKLIANHIRSKNE